MSASDIHSLSTKMGITSPKVLRKAKEFCQLVDIRSNSGSLAALKLTGSCKTVACLDLAASSYSHFVDKSCAVRISGTNKKMYMMCVKTLESILDIQPVQTVRDIAVQFGCTPAVELAQKILKKYIEKQSVNDDMDFNTSLFQGAALCAACKHQKVKVDRAKIKEMCAVKKTCFDALTADMEKIAETIEGEKKAVSKKRGTTCTLLDEVERQMKELPEKKSRDSFGDGDDEAETELTDYEEWKRKILENAAKANS